MKNLRAIVAAFAFLIMIIVPAKGVNLLPTPVSCRETKGVFPIGTVLTYEAPDSVVKRPSASGVTPPRFFHPPTPSPQSASDPPLKCPGLSLQAFIFVFLSFCPPIIPTSVICLSSAPFPIAFPSHVSVPSGLISGKFFEYVGDFTDLYKVICGEARFPLY